MLYHEYYVKFCRSSLTFVVNHDDTIPEKQLKKYVDQTDVAWKARNKRRVEAEKEVAEKKIVSKEKENAAKKERESLLSTKIDSSTSNVKAFTVKPGFKSRIKSLLSRNKPDKKNKAKPWPVVISSIPISCESIVPTNGYRPIKELLNGEYKNGRYGLEEDYESYVTDDGEIMLLLMMKVFSMTITNLQ